MYNLALFRLEKNRPSLKPNTVKALLPKKLRGGSEAGQSQPGSTTKKPLVKSQKPLPKTPPSDKFKKETKNNKGEKNIKERENEPKVDENESEETEIEELKEEVGIEEKEKEEKEHEIEDVTKGNDN